MKKSALDFMKTYKKHILAVMLFGICIAYMIASGISIYDDCYMHRDMSDMSHHEFMDYIKYNSILSPQASITFKEGLELIFRIWLKVTGAIMYGNVLYLWAWNDFLNREQKSEVAVCTLFGTFVFFVSWIWNSTTFFCLCLFVFIYSAYRLFLAFKSDDLLKITPILGMLVSAGSWIMLRYYSAWN